jgi:hypothetical protein
MTCGTRHALDARPAYVRYLLGYVQAANLKPLKIARFNDGEVSN